MEQIAISNVLISKEIKDKGFSYIFETYYKRIYNYIFYRINGKEEAEDLTSRVFEKAMLSIKTYSDRKSPFEVWLFAIARNVITDYFRSLKKQKLTLINDPQNLISREENPEDLVVKAETNDDLARSLNILSSRERHLIALKFGGNLKNKEISEILDITESNTAVILYRAIRKLKNEMEKES
ncbi:RNA polymerase, sigma-24 subunit, RpoE [Syntrophobotulus glycolicus DSM 8271]|uniref:RNA polymerase, sigma-24 subunit, RpoE n=1 Tax=Syntrophobotulus glycolicus (strain DSM 8271 / FlGlyR) TaxID=645991 RepID=F0T1F2_SYNGF|nr:sigma-70 family RNA polymerase sigma factor [Syntrophobotulus glycolicus]ADY56293.1 RNA polymerase, sigma-24 subunit, RpoE [Syntrophobotulus glycolicus DSM 8271]